MSNKRINISNVGTNEIALQPDQRQSLWLQWDELTQMFDSAVGRALPSSVFGTYDRPASMMSA